MERSTNGYTKWYNHNCSCSTAGCDIPAARKVSGFVGHRATLGCSRCLLPFPTANFGDKPDYSNFDRRLWKSETAIELQLQSIKKVGLKHQGQQLSESLPIGVRYSCLIQLPYYNAPRMCIIDPMHNLLLGTTKHTIEVWKNNGLITVKHLEEIQERVNSFCCPNDIGRMPSKIQSSFFWFFC